MQSTSALKFTTPLKIAYSLTLGSVVAFYLYVYLLYCIGNLGCNGDTVFSVFLRQLNGIFLVTALPIAIFTLVFLTKGGGLNYVKSWNKGKKLALSGLAVIIGYILVVFFPNTSIGHILNVSRNDYSITYFGLSLIAWGFFSIFLMYNKTFSAADKKSNH